MSLTSLLFQNKRTAMGAAALTSIPLVFSSLASAWLLQNLIWLQSLEQADWLPLFAVSALTMACALTPSTFVVLQVVFFWGGRQHLGWFWLT